MNSNSMVYKKVTITLPIDTVEKLKDVCKREHRSQSNLILHLIEEFEKFKNSHDNLHTFLKKNNDD